MSRARLCVGEAAPSAARVDVGGALLAPGGTGRRPAWGGPCWALGGAGRLSAWGGPRWPPGAPGAVLLPESEGLCSSTSEQAQKQGRGGGAWLSRPSGLSPRSALASHGPSAAETSVALDAAEKSLPETRGCESHSFPGEGRAASAERRKAVLHADIPTMGLASLNSQDRDPLGKT